MEMTRATTRFGHVATVRSVASILSILFILSKMCRR